MRLTDVFTGELTWPELDDLITHLPMESALRTAQRDQFTDEQLAEILANRDESTLKHGSWSKHEQLTALLIFEMRKLIWIQTLRGGVKDIPAPEPIRMPGSVTGKKTADPRAVTYLQAIRDRNARREAG